MQRRIALTLLSGVLAGLLPSLPGGGLFFNIVSAFFPLLFVGLSEGARAVINAGTIAVGVALIFGGMQPAMFIALFVMLPACLLVSRLLLYKDQPNGQKNWYPAMQALTELTLLAVGQFLATSMLMTSSKHATLGEIVKSSFSVDLTAFDTASAQLITMIVNDWSFLIFALMAWLWVAVTWGLAIFANRLLATRKAALRPSIQLNPHDLPFWLPLMMALFIALALLGDPNDAFSGKTVTLILLLPYFMSGMVMIHAMSRYWYPRQLWLALIYIILFFQAWTAIFICMAGLYHHLSEMLDKHRKIG